MWFRDIFFRMCRLKCVVLISSSVTCFSWTAPEKYNSSHVLSFFFHAPPEEIALLVNLQWLPTSVLLQHRSTAGSSREAGRGWWEQAHPGKHDLMSDAAFEVHTQFGVTWAIWRMSISCQRINTGCQQEMCNAGNDELGKALIRRYLSCCHVDWRTWQSGRVVKWGHSTLYWIGYRAHTSSWLVSQERHQREMSQLQFGAGRGKSNATSQGVPRQFLKVPVGQCPDECAWLRTAGVVILVPVL